MYRIKLVVTRRFAELVFPVVTYPCFHKHVRCTIKCNMTIYLTINSLFDILIADNYLHTI